MARRTFPVKKAGDSLDHRHVNGLSKVCEQVGFGGRASFINRHFYLGGMQPGKAPFLVLSLIIDEDYLNGTYNCFLRYWDASNSLWTTDTENTFLLDASESGTNHSVGDKVSAYWHSQRGAFLPIGGAGSGPVLRIGKTKELITADAFGEVELWRRNSDGIIEATGETIEIVWHDWIVNATDIEEDTEVILGYFSEDFTGLADGSKGIWRIIGAECPSTG